MRRRMIGIASICSLFFLPTQAVLARNKPDTAARYFDSMCRVVLSTLHHHYTQCFSVHAASHEKLKSCREASQLEHSARTICVDNQHLKSSQAIQDLAVLHHLLFGDDQYDRAYRAGYHLSHPEFALYNRYSDFITTYFLVVPTKQRAKILKSPLNTQVFIKHVLSTNQNALRQSVSSDASYAKWLFLYAKVQRGSALHQSITEKKSQIAKAKAQHANAQLLAEQQRTVSGQNQPHKMINVGAKLDWDWVHKSRGSGFANSSAERGYIGLAEASLEFDPVSWVSSIATWTYAQSAERGPKGAKVESDQLSATVGDLQKFPFYLTVGKTYYPFGVFIPFSFFGTVNQNMSGFHSPGMILGYSKDHLFGAVFSYARSGNVNRESKQDFADFSNVGGEIGVTSLAAPGKKTGYLATLSFVNHYAEMLSFSSLKPINLHRRGAIAVHFTYHYHNVGFVSDYLQTVSPYNASAFSFDGHGAEPKAWTNQVYYHFNLGRFPSTASLGYGVTQDALSLSEPRDLYMLTYAIQFNRFISLETQYSIGEDYSTHHSSTLATQTGNATRVGTGRTQQIIGLRLSAALGREHPDFPDTQ